LFVTHVKRRGRGRDIRPTAAVRTRGHARKEKPAVSIAWDGVRAWCGDPEIRRAARAALEHGGRADLALGIVFVNDRALAALHGRHLGDASPTDVITFDLSDDYAGPTGELYVSAECARRVARERGADPRRELALYVVHGALHLCGFDDHSRADRAAMRRAEGDVLASLGWERDTLPHDT
jgi:probable rRNA maturation factor